MNRLRQAGPELEIHVATNTNSGRTTVKTCLEGVPHGIAFSDGHVRFSLTVISPGLGAESFLEKNSWLSVGVKKYINNIFI